MFFLIDIIVQNYFLFLILANQNNIKINLIFFRQNIIRKTCTKWVGIKTLIN